MHLEKGDLVDPELDDHGITGSHHLVDMAQQAETVMSVQAWMQPGVALARRRVAPGRRFEWCASELGLDRDRRRVRTSWR